MQIILVVERFIGNFAPVKSRVSGKEKPQAEALGLSYISGIRDLPVKQAIDAYFPV